jgi:cell division protein FtsW
VPRIKSKPPDSLLLLTVLTLLSIGIVMVYSSSAVVSYADYGTSFYYLRRQAMWAGIGLVMMLIVSKINYWRYEYFARPILAGIVLLLILVLIPGIGQVVHGARRWLDFGVSRVQPSEFAKVAVVIYMAYSLTQKQPQLGNLKAGVLPHIAIVGLICGLVLLEPDLGTAVAIGGTVFIMWFVAGFRFTHLLTLVLLAVPVLGYAIWSEEYRRSRFLAFLNPWADPLGDGFHIIQSLYALGSGGLFGLGLGQSRQKLFYLPERHTDFIFAILGEELGFIGTVFVLALFFFFAWRGYKIAITAPDTFGSMLAVGITTMITLQAIINIGVVTGSMPITGIPLPFISFGGSSLIPILSGVGILLNISKYTKY